MVLWVWGLTAVGFSVPLVVADRAQTRHRPSRPRRSDATNYHLAEVWRGCGRGCRCRSGLYVAPWHWLTHNGFWTHALLLLPLSLLCVSAVSFRVPAAASPRAPRIKAITCTCWGWRCGDRWWCRVLWRWVQTRPRQRRCRPCTLLRNAPPSERTSLLSLEHGRRRCSPPSSSSLATKMAVR